MASKTIFRVEGLQELRRTLKELPRRTQKKITRKAVSEGAKPIVKKAKQLVPLLKAPVPHRKRGTVRKNIRYKVRVSGDNAEVSIWVKGLASEKIVNFKASTGKAGRDNPDDPFYWWFVEFGTRKMAARPFMRPAYESEKDNAFHKILESIDRGIQQELLKLNSRR